MARSFAAGSAGASTISPRLAVLNRSVPTPVVGFVLLGGLVVASAMMCYTYYPAADEALQEIGIARAETLSAANSGQVEHAAHWLPIWEEWSRRLEVGTYLRQGKLRPYQQMQGYLIRKKLELLEHELAHDPFEQEKVRKIVRELLAANVRWVEAFREPSRNDLPPIRAGAGP